MNMSTDNMQFMLQNNPEHYIIDLSTEVKRSVNRIEYLENENRNLINAILQLQEELEFQRWYAQLPFYKRFWWTMIKKLTIETIKTKYYV